MKYIVNNKIEELFNNILIGCAKLMTLNYEFIYLNICGYNVVCTHGDLDKFKNIGITINSLFSKKYGKAINYTFSGDKHHLESFEQFGIESTLVGSLCGTDEYANNKRLYSNPMQTLCIFTPEDGKLCTYNIKL